MLISCAGCEKPILDKFLLNVLERTWHADCVRCYDCHHTLSDKCFSREGKLFCRNDFFRPVFHRNCGSTENSLWYGCGVGLSSSMLISCAGCEKPILDKFLLNVLERTWHADCVRCYDCHHTLSDKCFSREGKLFCRNDFF
ncbi:LIM/homeobox protein Lhx5-like, partial [Diaphorina citri]|uniref:LIM/homeobox protein Lhx5-like n=1 Tax=Diaphorina citri TaxID=121845 RepID=A0A1S3DLX1_DIACI